jgi:hypothetical protein
VFCCLPALRPSQKSRRPDRRPSSSKPKCARLGRTSRTKIEDGFAAILADGFREVEEDSNGFGDKKAIPAHMDQFELSQYTLKDFDARPVGANTALVTYMADYNGKFAGEPLQAKTAYGEVWTKRGNEWKLLYVQETKVQ